MKPKQTSDVPMNAIKKLYKQVIHKKCGGEIVLVSDGDDAQFACNSCRELWLLNSPFIPLESKMQLPDDMETITVKETHA